ncbi:hypothetical protein JTE90_013456 [Oedothorax gibbosus]|uniref:Uncharacterized protein n=1 Tax=Oedothorax gibbosus TaxID=931172 RepID=A0AAV6VL60_9ARAC|nr:hypothetical protein JTE90_013456 [Oedothorax gibbosus]
MDLHYLEAIIPKTSDGHIDFAAILNNIQSQNTDLKAFMPTTFSERTSLIKQNRYIIHDLKSTIADLQNSNLALQSKQSQLENENINTNKQGQELKQEIIELKQYLCRNNLEISNLLKSQKKDIIQVMKSLQEAAGVSFVDKIIALHRVYT